MTIRVAFTVPEQKHATALTKPQEKCDDVSAINIALARLLKKKNATALTKPLQHA
jgi:hypothetical protein